MDNLNHTIKAKKLINRSRTSYAVTSAVPELHYYELSHGITDGGA